ncbi:radical SAM protein [bacterium]|nr:radical SAM protein [bacterium]
MSRSVPSILLVNPWIVDFAAYDFWNKPVGLLSVGAALRDAGCEIRLLDCMDRYHPALAGEAAARPVRAVPTGDDGSGHFPKTILDKPQLLAAVPRRWGRYGLLLETVRSLIASEPAPDVVLVTSGMTYWYPGVQAVIACIRERHPGVPVLLGGIYATLCAEHARRLSGADRVIPGEGERTGLEAVAAITGLRIDSSRAADAEPFPAPAQDLYPVLRSASLITSRGCPFRCPFCASHLLTGGGFKTRSPECVVREIESLFREKGTVDFAFVDDALLFRKEEHFLPLLKLLAGKQLPLRLHAPNGMHPSWIDGETAVLMRKTGFRTIRLSMETVNPDRLREMGGKVTAESLKEAVRRFVEAGYRPAELGAYAIMGLPGQPIAETAETLAFVFSLGLRISLAAFSPIPGTVSWDEAVRTGLIAKDADPLVSNHAAFLALTRPAEYGRYVKLGTLAADGNGMLKSGIRPMEDRAFRKRLSEFT